MRKTLCAHALIVSLLALGLTACSGDAGLLAPKALRAPTAPQAPTAQSGKTVKMGPPVR